MLLHARHGRGPVVRDDDDGVALVVGHVQKRRDPGMNEGGVSDHPHDLPLSLFLQGLAHAVGHADAGPHADAGMQAFERFHVGQRVAADVPRHEGLQFSQDVKEPAMRAPRTEIGRPRRDGDSGQVRRFPGFAADGPFDHPGIEFVGVGKDLLPGDLDSHGPDLLFDEGVQFLDHVELFHPGREFPDHPDRQRMDHAQFQVGIAGEDILGVMIRDAPRDDAGLGAVHLHPVFEKGLGEFPKRQRPLFDLHPAGAGIDGDHDVFGGVDPDVRPVVRRLRLLQFDDGLGMGDPRRGPKENGRVEFFADLEGQLDELLRLPRIGRLQHGDLREFRVVPVVLLVL